jgi:hypothetical protein
MSVLPSLRVWLLQTSPLFFECFVCSSGVTEGGGVRSAEFLSPDHAPPGGGCLLQGRSSRDLAPAEQSGSLLKECRHFLKSGGQVRCWRSACYFRACRFLSDHISLLPEFCLLLGDIHSSWNHFALLNPSRNSSSPLWNYRENSKENVRETMRDGRSLMHSQRAESSSRNK